VDLLPQNLSYLTFGACFNLQIDLLPQTLTHLTLGQGFNQPLDLLPHSLSHLSFGDDRDMWCAITFSYSLENLPESLTHLSFFCIVSKTKVISFGIPSRIHVTYKILPD